MNTLKHIGRLCALFFILGMCYTTIELFVRGYTYLQMLFVGGLCGVFIGLLNSKPAYYNRTIWQQCFLGTLITLSIEFVSGMIMNKWLKLNIWDYSCLQYNCCGQICLKTAIMWFFLMPFAIYADDWLRWKLFSEPKPQGNVFTNYIRLFTFR